MEIENNGKLKFDVIGKYVCLKYNVECNVKLMIVIDNVSEAFTVVRGRLFS